MFSQKGKFPKTDIQFKLIDTWYNLEKTLRYSQHFSSEIPDGDDVRLCRLYAGEILGHVVAHAPAERVVVFTSRVLQVVVTLVVHHLVGSQVHGGIEKLGQGL